MLGHTNRMAIVEAAYRVEQSERDWLSGVVEAFHALDRGGGVEAYFVDCSSGFSAWGHTASMHRDPTLWEGWCAAVPESEKRFVHTHAPAGYSTSLPADAQSAIEWASVRTHGLLGINALDARWKGVALVGHDGPGRAAPSEEEIVVWGMLGCHVAAGARIRAALEASTPEPEAVLTPGGTLVHAEGRARDEVARAELRRAVVERDHARTRRAAGWTDADSLEAWRALVSGRWSLVDSFERDGRQYVLARPNDPVPEPHASFTSRERQVLDAAALGHANKLIAYELGVSTSTVATLLRRAARKAGRSTRSDLVRWWRARRP